MGSNGVAASSDSLPVSDDACKGSMTAVVVDVCGDLGEECLAGSRQLPVAPIYLTMPSLRVNTSTTVPACLNGI